MRFLGIWLLTFSLTAFSDQAPENRVALVIGNSAYVFGPLENPVTDARAMAKTLERSGFKVIKRENASQKDMIDSIAEFGDALKKGGGVGLFYYAGHGLQIKGRNFLVPVNADIKREDDATYMAVDANMVTDKMEGASNRLNIVILDACRNNPFAKAARSGGGGLAQMDAPVGTLVAFSTAPGSVASDGAGQNGLYTQHLLANIEQSGLRIEEVFKKVRLGVRLDSAGMQVPWENTSLEGDFFFKAGDMVALHQPPALLIGTGRNPPPGVAAIAKTEQGYRFLQEGKIDQAEDVFKEIKTDRNPEVVHMGSEGLAEILLVRGKIDEVLAATKTLISEAPNRTAAYLIRGRALAIAGQVQEAKLAIKNSASAGKLTDFSWQKSNLYVASAAIERKDNPAAAVKLYQQASKENPQSVTALSNHAALLKDMGDPKKAAELLQKAQTIDPTDKLTQALLRQAQEAIAQQQDAQRQKYIDDSVKDLVARFKEQKTQTKERSVDDWTSPVMAVSMLGFQDFSAENFLGRVGAEGILAQEFSRELLASNIAVVDRAVLDKVMAELKLGSSELADPDTQLKLGRLFAARLIFTGNIYSGNPQGMINLRGIDVETTRIAVTQSEKVTFPLDPFKTASGLAQLVSQDIKSKYPLKGRIADAAGETVIVNLGTKHGVSSGQVFNVLGKSEPIELNGRILGYKETKLGQLEIVEAQELMAFAKPVDIKGVLEKNQKIILKK